jgi:hypothetical protein
MAALISDVLFFFNCWFRCCSDGKTKKHSLTAPLLLCFSAKIRIRNLEMLLFVM